MNWKDMLKVFLGALLPALFTALIAKHPDFPIFLDEFVSLGLWIAGLILGGWGMGSMYKNAKLKKAGYDYETLVSK